MIQRFNKFEFIFAATFLAIILDNIINFYFSAPIFIAYSLILAIISFPLFARLSIGLYIFILFVLTIKGWLYGVDINGLGYLIFIANFLVFSKIATYHEVKIKASIIVFAFIVFLLMFSAHFVGVNSYENVDITSSGANTEFYRIYNTGFFRAPHLVAMIMSFFAIYFAWALHRSSSIFKKIEFITFIAISFYCIILSGVRTPLYAMLASTLIIWLIAKPVVALFLLGGLSILIYNISGILSFIDNPYLFQQLSFIESAVFQPERLSRLQLAYSFYSGVSEFNYFELIFGKSFESSLIHNLDTIGMKIWFHNDFLAVFFQFGLIGLAIIVATFKKLVSSGFIVREKYYLFACLFIVFTSFFNGFIYHYVPLYFLMVAILKGEECEHSIHIGR